MKKALLLLATAGMVAAAGAASAADKQLVIVVKGLDNPFFEAIHQGCEKWNSENANSEYECFYTGPASTSDEAGEAQIVADMLAKSTTAAMAISPSNAPLIANTLKQANPSIPIMTVDADLTQEDAGLRALVGLQLENLLSLEEHAAPRDLVAGVAGQDLGEGALSGPVGPQQPHDLSRFDSYRNRVEHGSVSAPHRDRIRHQNAHRTLHRVRRMRTRKNGAPISAVSTPRCSS